jgi:uncharacterized protein YmfQ (DUF2313 family)
MNIQITFIALCFAGIMHAEQVQFVVPKKEARKSVAKLKEEVGQSYGAIIQRTSQVNSCLVDCMEPLMEGTSISQQALKSHRQSLAEFEAALTKLETALQDYQNTVQKSV